MAARKDPYAHFNFIVDIDGVNAAGFSEVAGLASEVEVMTYREGGDSRVRQLPGLAKFPRVVLKRGFTADRTLWDWHRTALVGPVQRKNVRITLLDSERQPVARWTLSDAWPAKWQGPDLNARSSDVTIESLELVHEGLELVD
jgi:phage tail-like protein